MTASLHRARKLPAHSAAREPAQPAARITAQPAPSGWEFVERIGEGRWAYVYSARTVETVCADYAIKVPKHCPEARAMLQRESLIGSTVSHPNLMPVLEWQRRGEPYLVMPRIAGHSLRRILALRRREFGCLMGAAKFLSHSVWTMRQLASALTALHSAGWLHGDVKPENVLVSPQGQATLLDLGLAKRLGTRECRGGEILAGTLAYVAPESYLSAQTLSEASDIYSLGVIMYELLTGQPMFDETDPTRLSLLHLRQAPVDVREVALNVPPPLARLVMRMLAKEPLRRPPASEVVWQLTRLEIEWMASR